MARVLVADDASFMRQMIREIVEAEGHEVVGEASDGDEAVEAIGEYMREREKFTRVVDSAREMFTEESRGGRLSTCSTMGVLLDRLRADVRRAE